MANISVTQLCNQHCTYCFSRPTVGRAEMRFEDFDATLDLLQRSGVPEVRLVGGEPTLHPEFAGIVQRSIERGFSVRVFSNGLMPSTALEALQAIPPDRCAVVVNVPCPTPPPQAAKLGRLLRALGPRASIGLNLYRTGLPLESSLDLIDEYALSRVVRLGLAHPCLGASNAFLHPKYYPAVGRELLHLLEVALLRRITLTFDCGFVPCMFSREFWDLIGPQAAEIGCQCGAIPDILPDRSAIHCFALGNWEQLPTSGPVTTQELNRRFQEKLQPGRGAGVFADCGRCAWQAQGRCNGGCRALIWRRFHGLDTDPTLSRHSAAAPNMVPRVLSGASRGRASDPMGKYRRIDSPCPRVPPASWTLPYIDQPASFWEMVLERYGDRVAGIYFPLPSGHVPTGRPVQPTVHLAQFLHLPRLPKNVLLNPVSLPAAAEQVFRQIHDELKRLVDEFGVQSVTIADLELARIVRNQFPNLKLCASVLLNIATTEEAARAAGLFDIIVPGSGLIRQPARLAQLRAAFPGKLRLLVNESCLSGCAFRRQHFHEMAYSDKTPASLCGRMLEERPWLRMTGAWVLPQHLALLDEFADEFKLAGRATLQDSERYLQVCDAYIHRLALWPDEIGGGPASLLDKQAVSFGLAQYLQQCGQSCDTCTVCARLGQGSTAHTQDRYAAQTTARGT